MTKPTQAFTPPSNTTGDLYENSTLSLDTTSDPLDNSTAFLNTTDDSFDNSTVFYNTTSDPLDNSTAFLNTTDNPFDNSTVFFNTTSDPLDNSTAFFNTTDDPFDNSTVFFNTTSDPLDNSTAFFNTTDDPFDNSTVFFNATSDPLDNSTAFFNTTDDPFDNSTVSFYTTSDPLDNSTAFFNTTDDPFDNSTVFFNATSDPLDNSTAFFNTTDDPFDNSTVFFNATSDPLDNSTAFFNTTDDPFDNSTVSFYTTSDPLDNSTAFLNTTDDPFDNSTVFYNTTSDPLDNSTVFLSTTDNPFDNSTVFFNATSDPLDNSTAFFNTTDDPFDNSTVFFNTTSDPLDNSTAFFNTTDDPFDNSTVSFNTTSDPLDNFTVSSNTTDDPFDNSTVFFNTTSDPLGNSTVFFSTTLDPLHNSTLQSGTTVTQTPIESVCDVLNSQCGLEWATPNGNIANRLNCQFGSSQPANSQNVYWCPQWQRRADYYSFAFDVTSLPADPKNFFAISRCSRSSSLNSREALAVLRTPVTLASECLTLNVTFKYKLSAIPRSDFFLDVRIGKPDETRVPADNTVIWGKMSDYPKTNFTDQWVHASAVFEVAADERFTINFVAHHNDGCSTQRQTIAIDDIVTKQGRKTDCTMPTPSTTTSLTTPAKPLCPELRCPDWKPLPQSDMAKLTCTFGSSQPSSSQSVYWCRNWERKFSSQRYQFDIVQRSPKNMQALSRCGSVAGKALLRTPLVTVRECSHYQLTFSYNLTGVPVIGNQEADNYFLDVRIGKGNENRIPDRVIWRTDLALPANQWQNITVEFDVDDSFTVNFVAHHSSRCSSHKQAIALDDITTKQGEEGGGVCTTRKGHLQPAQGIY
ncbi:uncharacterized protein LOC129589788 isoform X1 [Paramacrobiotus metropolitanus]|uniref:uncharacterized protein LOC129589788 isoform X1 n=1 Tax=Paramacrobiotus metropolitanus TaxID=2943436 RepID=UPI0024459FB8|nr:uncharacterized protein LOC129589788 isoform X1 [Paramacrobiotus metropolitanus]XP_055340626.1 uncharacterized protein LOC129589788 isoform X1 [Paramacrobiotus metropolitanus]